MKDGFLKIAACAPKMKVADCHFNQREIIRSVQSAHQNGVSVLVFPELCITGYTCQDLFLQTTLQRGALQSLCTIATETANCDVLFAVGLPYESEGKLYNVAAVICHGEILAIIPKKQLPNYGEFYEKRWFAEAPDNLGHVVTLPDGRQSWFGIKQLLRCKNYPLLTVGVEICEDGWVTTPPSCLAAQNGATVILNLSASDEVIGKMELRKKLFSSLSSKLTAVYLFSSAGPDESTTDLIFGGHQMLFENGSVIGESLPFGDQYCETECDLEKIRAERIKMTSFTAYPTGDYHVSEFTLPIRNTTLTRSIARFPFVPSDTGRREQRCSMITTMQATALAKRLEHIGCGAVVGISGGLDSTLALLVTVKAFDLLKRDRIGITCITMPGFGTTNRTKSNAEILCERLGVTFRTIPIGDAVRQHFSDIGHDGITTDITYENAQARERTQILMDVANQTGSIVIGTGDLSELALGWATYNGDHMSMYGVNASIPKTLVRHLVSYFASISEDEVLRQTLLDILATPVSPELLPPSGDGEIAQITEDLVGPYELHDFFLYYVLRFGYSPSKIYRLAQNAWAETYSDETILKWLKNFYRRFFTQQFKRSCLPDGPKIGSVSLSPRGDWRMPSDANASLWQKELEDLK